MNGKSYKPIILSTILFLLMLPVESQNGGESESFSTEDSLYCGRYISAYREFFRLEIYEHAYDPWWKVFNDCPGYSEKLYVDGARMYRHIIEEAPEGPAREDLIDTLMLIYDRRLEYFGGEGNVLGRKGKDLLTYRRGDIEQVQEAYAMLNRSIELEGKKSNESVMVLFISAGVVLNQAERIDNNQLIGDYLKLVEILDQLVTSSSRWERARSTIDEIMQNNDLLSCDALNHYYEQQFEQNRNDASYLQQMITICSASGCDRSDSYARASESLYRIEPGPESAHNLAILFINRNNFEKAVKYLKEALQGENIDMETRALWNYELAVVSNANKDYCEAVEYAREAINLKKDYGKAYILIGDAFIASRDILGDDFEQRTAFWAAADKYREAALADPSLAEETRKKLSDYVGQYPNSEDIFFHDIKEGDSILVGGCINEYTIVRPRK